ncbi:type VI secretion system baseplate subunit TssE [Psychromonas sp. Urea-02u-13]|uniref:type VI secretion system baseplate subunit TssE n=1 Tax=Psychromonas sp. Urea-02u-13 TaxID=2058326 RepID=UPI000C34865A|nr:type VI secretion system baseplate subunit TssE [Psychromonas sp. Urea-02u-13]PKG38767.1 type VI secretion system baseplate subunit TssE [Psychromonas sp. Urea-02u-13]
MTRLDKDKKLRPSILDRLFDDEPQYQSEQKVQHHQQVKELKAGISRDLESLLNTRYHMIKPSSDFPEVDKSIFNYGLPDLATVNIRDVEHRKKFISHLETILKSYEPRFKSVKVAFVDNSDNADRTLRFRIDTVIYADPIPEVVIFDSTLDSVTRSVSVKEI